MSSLLFGFFSPRRTTKLVKNKKIFFPFHLSLSLSTGSSPSWPRRKGPGERINVCLHVYGPMAIPWLDSLPFPRPASVSLFIAFKLSMSSCHLPLFSFCALAPSFYGHLDERGEREREREVTRARRTESRVKHRAHFSSFTFSFSLSYFILFYFSLFFASAHLCCCPAFDPLSPKLYITVWHHPRVLCRDRYDPSLSSTTTTNARL